jgi:23S rRNA (cytidine1920-2'-O)/16S rRNA (cytidine1409-2'-O)-methyltransferase
VAVLDGINARHLDPARLDPRPSLAVVDVAFISLEKVLPPVARCLAPEPAATRVEIVALVKPQFEVGRGRVGKGGVVRDPAQHGQVLLRLGAFAEANGLWPAGVVASPLRGAKGNREFFLHLLVGGVPPAPVPGAVFAAAVAEAVGGETAGGGA